jgi:hypothetical protein
VRPLPLPTNFGAFKVSLLVNVRDALVVVEPLPLPIISCPAVLFIVFCLVSILETKALLVIWIRAASKLLVARI